MAPKSKSYNMQEKSIASDRAASVAIAILISFVATIAVCGLILSILALVESSDVGSEVKLSAIMGMGSQIAQLALVLNGNREKLDDIAITVNESIVHSDTGPPGKRKRARGGEGEV